MPKRRDQIRMSEAEMWEFIRGQKSLQVATLGRDGSPHLTTLWFAVVDGEIVFETFAKSQKLVNLERDPRIAVLLEDGSTYEELRGVSISGRAELHRDPDLLRRFAAEIIRRNRPEVSEEAMEEAAARMAAKRAAVVVKPEKIVSWDHRKLAGPRGRC
jgi:PPOX class probable F420-dependent enzyme